MNNRRKYEGEEELQLQLLEVTQDPTFGRQNAQRQVPPQIPAEGDCDDEADRPGTELKRLH